jgi:hypothetical protein
MAMSFGAEQLLAYALVPECLSPERMEFFYQCRSFQYEDVGISDVFERFDRLVHSISADRFKVDMLPNSSSVASMDKVPADVRERLEIAVSSRRASLVSGYVRNREPTSIQITVQLEEGDSLSSASRSPMPLSLGLVWQLRTTAEM